MQPNFLIIGAAKSGTTTLYHYLRQHPEVYMSEPKEPRFFELNYSKGMDFYWNTYFRGWSGQKAIGEASPCNLYLPYVPKRIKDQLPEAKLIAILRNPVDRAFSHWWMTYSLGVEKLPFREAIQANLELLNSGFSFDGEDGERLWRESIYWGEKPRQASRRWYLDMGYYAQQLKRYFRLFPSSQIKVLLFDDLRHSPEAVLAEIAYFLGITPEFELLDRSPQMVATPQIGVPVLRLTKRAHLHALIPRKLRRSIAMFLSKYSSKPAMEAETRNWLIEHYYPHNRELEELLGIELSAWDR